MTDIILNLLGSTLLGAVTTIWAQWSKNKQDNRAYELQIMAGERKAIQQARVVKNEGFMWTRRTIALTATFSVLVLPKVCAIYGIDTWWATKMLEGGFWFFSESKEVITWTKMSGVVITPIDVHVMASVVGLYFGGSLARR